LPLCTNFSHLPFPLELLHTFFLDHLIPSFYVFLLAYLSCSLFLRFSYFSIFLFFAFISCHIFPSDFFISCQLIFTSPSRSIYVFSVFFGVFLLFTSPSKNSFLHTAFLEQIMSCTNTTKMRVVRLYSVFRLVPHLPTRIIIGESRKYRSVGIVDDEYARIAPSCCSVFLSLPFSLSLSLSLFVRRVLVPLHRVARWCGGARQLINRHNRAHLLARLRRAPWLIHYETLIKSPDISIPTTPQPPLRLIALPLSFTLRFSAFFRYGIWSPGIRKTGSAEVKNEFSRNNYSKKVFLANYVFNYSRLVYG